MYIRRGNIEISCSRAKNCFLASCGNRVIDPMCSKESEAHTKRKKSYCSWNDWCKLLDLYILQPIFVVFCCCVITTIFFNPYWNRENWGLSWWQSAFRCFYVVWVTVQPVFFRGFTSIQEACKRACTVWDCICSVLCCLVGLGGKLQIAHIDQDFSFCQSYGCGNQQGLTGRTQIESKSVSQPPYNAKFQWVWKVAERLGVRRTRLL